MHLGGSQFHMGDIIFQLFGIFSMLVPIALLIFVIVMIVKFNRRGKESLELQKQQSLENALLKEELVELKKRVSKIEATLKEVE